MLFVRVAQILKRIFYTHYDKRNIRKANREEPISNLISRKFNILTKNQKKSPPLGVLVFVFHYFKNPLTICSSASASVNPKVISLMSCSPAILPMAAS